MLILWVKLKASKIIIQYYNILEHKLSPFYSWSCELYSASWKIYTSLFHSFSSSGFLSLSLTHTHTHTQTHTHKHTHTHTHTHSHSERENRITSHRPRVQSPSYAQGHIFSWSRNIVIQRRKWGLRPWQKEDGKTKKAVKRERERERKQFVKNGKYEKERNYAYEYWMILYKWWNKSCIPQLKLLSEPLCWGVTG